MKYPANTSDLRLVRGEQNEVAFCLRDVDHKPVSLPGDDSLTIHIVDTDANKLLLTRDLLALDVARGIYQLILTSDDIAAWPTGPLRWTLVRNRADTTVVMLWTDQDYTPSGKLYIAAPPLPGPYL